MQPRLYFLDWVRIGAFALLVLYHVGMYYVTWDWHVKSPFASVTLEPLMLASSPWRLSLLFFISGVATAFLLAKGETGFLRRRSARLLIPLLFGMLVVVTPQAYYEVVEQLPGGYHDGYLAFWARYLQADPTFCRDGDCLDVPTWNHLWFVAYLWVYTLVLCLLRWALRGRVQQAADALATRWSTGWGLLVVPIVALALARVALVARFESTHALVDDWYNHAQYLPLFLLGAALARTPAIWTRFTEMRWLSTGAAMLAYAGVAAYFGTYGDAAHPPPEWLRMAQRVGWAVFQWSAIVAIIGWAARVAPGDSRARRYLTEAVFPVYILHQTLIVVLAHNAQRLGLAPEVEGPLLVVATLTGCFAGYEAIRRVGPLRPLFGLRQRRQPQATADTLHAQPTASIDCAPP